MQEAIRYAILIGTGAAAGFYHQSNPSAAWVKHLPLVLAGTSNTLAIVTDKFVAIYGDKSPPFTTFWRQVIAGAPWLYGLFAGPSISLNAFLLTCVEWQSSSPVVWTHGSIFACASLYSAGSYAWFRLGPFKGSFYHPATGFNTEVQSLSFFPRILALTLFTL